MDIKIIKTWENMSYLEAHDAYQAKVDQLFSLMLKLELQVPGRHPQSKRNHKAPN